MHKYDSCTEPFKNTFHRSNVVWVSPIQLMHPVLPMSAHFYDWQWGAKSWLHLLICCWSISIGWDWLSRVVANWCLLAGSSLTAEFADVLFYRHCVVSVWMERCYGCHIRYHGGPFQDYDVWQFCLLRTGHSHAKANPLVWQSLRYWQCRRYNFIEKTQSL